jgi:hypothetical protein
LPTPPPLFLFFADEALLKSNRGLFARRSNFVGGLQPTAFSSLPILVCKSISLRKKFTLHYVNEISILGPELEHIFIDIAHRPVLKEIFMFELEVKFVYSVLQGQFRLRGISISSNFIEDVFEIIEIMLVLSKGGSNII